MKNRKNDNVNLDKFKQVFLALGFIAIIGLVFLAFSLKSYDKVSYNFKVSIDEMQEDLPPLIPPPIQIPPPVTLPPKKQPKEPELEIVEDEIEIPEEDFEEEDEEELEIEEDTSDEDAEEVEAAPLFFVKNMPHYKECSAGNNMQRNACTRKLLNKRIHGAFVMPDIARDMGYEGTVYVRFVVSPSGAVTDVTAMKGEYPVLNEAAVAAVKKLPNMIPGKQLDRAVPVVYTVPIKIEF